MGAPKPKAQKPPPMITPAPAPPPPLPTIADPAVAEAAKKTRQAELNSRGRSSTILTGTSGIEETSKKKTLLGE